MALAPVMESKGAGLALLVIFCSIIVYLVGKYHKFIDMLMRLLRLAMAQNTHKKKYFGKVWSFVDHFESMVDKDPSAIQLILAETAEKRTRRGVDELANQVAVWAQSKGLYEGDCAALMLYNQLDYPSIWLGLAKLGVSTALLNTNVIGPPFLHSVRTGLAQNKGAKVLIIDPELRNTLQSEVEELMKEGIEVFFWDSLSATVRALDSARPSPSLRSQTKENHSLVFIFTSGTTGLPKACKVTHTRYYSASFFFPLICNLSSKDVIYSPLPLYHSAGGTIGLGGAIYIGAPFVMRKKFSVKAFSADCLAHGVTAVQYIGELCRYLVQAPPSPWDSQLLIRAALGNGMRPDYWEAFQKRYNVQQIVEFYAATEGNVTLMNALGKVGALGYVPPILDSTYPTLLVKVSEEDQNVPLRDEKGLCIKCKPGEPGLLLSEVTTVSACMCTMSHICLIDCIGTDSSLRGLH
jgi:acyl-CoA synthetase (AMP-forming)/AMP-acid ligase II